MGNSKKEFSDPVKELVNEEKTTVNGHGAHLEDFERKKKLVLWLSSYRSRAQNMPGNSNIHSEARTEVRSEGDLIQKFYLYCRNGENRGANSPECPGVVTCQTKLGREEKFSQRHSRPCPCSHYVQKLSKLAVMTLQFLPWEKMAETFQAQTRSEIFSLNPQTPWITGLDENLIANALEFVVQRFWNIAILPPEEVGLFKDCKLSPNQKKSLSEFQTLSRALRLVDSSVHSVLSWSMIKDIYLFESNANGYPPLMQRSDFIKNLSEDITVTIVFDTLYLKGIGGRSSELLALETFIDDLYLNNNSLVAFSKYPLFENAFEFKSKTRSFGGNEKLLPGVDTPQTPRVYKDSRGRARVSWGTPAKGKLTPTLQSSLSSNSFERLIQMLSQNGLFDGFNKK
jgi:hypothetical protein